MSEPRDRERGASRGYPPELSLESGILPKGVSDQLDRPPPWEVVHEYLASGEHAVWVEAFAARSAAFADVLAALRSDHDERRPDARRRAAAPARRRKA